MMGDAYDLSAVLLWAKKRIWDEMKDPHDENNRLEWPFPEEVRLEVAESLVDLCRCFDNAEQAHRREYIVSGTKGEIKVSSPDPFCSAGFGMV